MTTITTEDGKPVLRDGKVGVESACCCNGECLCCSCVERVAYVPSEPGANAQPFAGILPEGGSWQWDGYQYYGEFPCHYVEYAFSAYAASIFPNAVNAGADAAYSGGGTWTKVAIDYYGTTGETRCTGSTEANCQPCLAYPGTAPPSDPLPTLAQLQQQCGNYHPCTPCEACSAVDGCGVAGTNRSQAGGETYPNGIPWPPPEGTCPCRPCDVLCLEQVTTFFLAKPKTTIVDGEHIYNYNAGPETLPPPITNQPANVWMTGGYSVIDGEYASFAFECASKQNPIRHPYSESGWTVCGPSEKGVWIGTSGPSDTPDGWWDDLYPWRVVYWRVRVVADCCECSGTEVITPPSVCDAYSGGDEVAWKAACGGIHQISLPPGISIPGAVIPDANCPTPTLCGTACWDAPTECNPLP